VTGVEVDLHQLELRHEDLRIQDANRRRRLIASVAEIGQQVPVVVVHDDDQLVLIDGYLRVEALRRLGRDTAVATAWPVTEAEALLHHHHLASAAGRSAIEDAWLLSRLRWHGLAQDELARRLCRSKSWVSRRLALIDELATAVQAAVRAGTVTPHAAMKYLVPLARANRGQCEQLIAGLGSTRVSSRDVGALYEAWRRADAAGRQRLVAEPLLLLRALAAAAAEPAVDDEAAPLLKDLTTIATIAWRARRRVHHGGAFTAEQTQAWRAATDAFASLRAAIEETHAGSVHPGEHPGAA
jgi:ParB-like chromosome segregation protein Spo0J